MSTTPFVISQSKMSLWQKCRRAYHYRYVEKLRRKRVSRPLQFGRIVHQMLEADANGDDPFAVLDKVAKEQGKLFRAEVEEYGDIVADVRVIMEDYFAHHGERSLVFIRKNGRAAEHEFEIELIDGINLTGKIDGVAKTPNKLRWLVEHKSFSRMPNEDHRWRNLQSASYIRVMDILGWQSVDGTCWDYIKSKAPALPTTLKSGKVSQRGIDSLPTAILQYIENEGLELKDFKSMLVAVKHNRREWFPRIFTPVKKKVVDQTFRDVIETAREIAEMHGKTKARSLGRHCEWCDFEGLCRAEFLGLDVDHVKEKEYYVHVKTDDPDRAVTTD